MYELFYRPCFCLKTSAAPDRSNVFFIFFSFIYRSPTWNWSPVHRLLLSLSARAREDLTLVFRRLDAASNQVFSSAATSLQSTLPSLVDEVANLADSIFFVKSVGKGEGNSCVGVSGSVGSSGCVDADVEGVSVDGIAGNADLITAQFAESRRRDSEEELLLKILWKE